MLNTLRWKLSKFFTPDTNECRPGQSLTFSKISLRAFRGLSGTYNVRANELDRATPVNIECLVQFLDNTQQTFVLPRRSKGQCLLDCVFRHLNLIETDFFGLKHLPQESQVHSTHSNNNSINNNHIISIHNCNSGTLSNSSTKSSDSLKQPQLQQHHSQVQLKPNNIINTNTITTNTTITTTTTTNNNNNNINAISNNNNNDDTLHSSTSIPTSTSLEERWLDPTKSIRKQCKSGPPYKFYFRVKFYVSDPCKLADDTTRNHLYLQLRQDILNNRLIVPTCSAILLASYILQSEVGDYKHELLEENYASNFKLLPNQNDDIKKKVIELHKQHKSLSPADAEYQFLEHAAKKLDCYGVDLYEARDVSKSYVQIGVSSNGIIIFRDSKRTNQFSWAKITKIMFKKKIFSIELRRDEGEICDNFIEYNLLTNQACKSFWEECVAQHSFFRLHQPKSPPKKFFSFLNFSSKFQYNGKTEYQTMEESRKRSFSHFSRTLSMRYARRTLPIGRPAWIDSSNREDSQSCSKEKASNSNGIKSNQSSSNNSQDSIDQFDTLAKSIAAIKKSLEKKDLIAEFEKLSRKNEEESLDESKSMENIDKNRYRDILPYDSTRVQLLDSMTGDYINASFVDMPVPSGVINRYIATQGPLESTCDDFWQMVWEQNCSLIIMVTPLVEAGRVKCHKYWPDEKEEVRYGQIFVRNNGEKSKTATIDRTIQLVDCKVSY